MGVAVVVAVGLEDELVNLRIQLRIAPVSPLVGALGIQRTHDGTGERARLAVIPGVFRNLIQPHANLHQHLATHLRARTARAAGDFEDFIDAFAVASGFCAVIRHLVQVFLKPGAQQGVVAHIKLAAIVRNSVAGGVQQRNLHTHEAGIHRLAISSAVLRHAGLRLGRIAGGIKARRHLGGSRQQQQRQQREEVTSAHHKKQGESVI